jgi:hypothetical protein
MLDFIKFGWRCFKHAWRGCWTMANELAGLLGGGILFVILFLLRDWLRAMNWIEAPTTLWGTAGYAVALAVASVVLSFLVIFSWRLALAPAQLYWEQYRKAERLRDELCPAKSGAQHQDSGPNWLIDELFTHIDPDLLSRTDDGVGDRWDEIGNAIRDQAAIGHLKIWGRTMPNGADSILGQRASLRLIEPDYWTIAFFTYSFFDSTAGDVPHTYLAVGRNGVQYTDLQVNRAQVLKLWPGEPDDLAEGYPNVRLADSPAVLALFDGVERAKIIALLTQEKISSWARVSASVSHDFVLLAGSVWAQSAFRCDPKNPADAGSINQTYLRQRNTTNAAFYDVCMNFFQLKRAWPSLEIRRTKCDVL